MAARLTRRRLLLAPVGLALADVLAACRAPDRRELPPAATPIPMASPAPAGPKRGGEVVWGVRSGPGDLDPHAPSWWSAPPAWADLVHQSLVMFDQNLRVTPALAVSWELEHPASWVFRLRRGVRYHDGSELAADDVVSWFERTRAVEQRAGVARWAAIVGGVEKIGPDSVRFKLTEPFAPLLVWLAALNGTAIVPRRWAERGSRPEEVVGTGPFKVVQVEPGRRLRLARHDRYWERGEPKLDAVAVEVVPDAGARMEAQRGGRLAGASFDGPEASVVGSPDGRQILRGPPAVLWAHHLNTRARPFDDARVRQAIALAIDRRAAIDRVAGGRAVLSGPIPPGHRPWAFPPEALPYRRDLERARQLLAEAGYGEGLRAALLCSVEAREQSLSAILAEQARAIGIEFEVRALDRADLERALASRDFDVVASVVPYQPDPHDYLGRPYRGGSAENVTGWARVQFDELVDRGRTMLDPNLRRPIYEEAQARLLDDAPSIWWYAEEHVEVTSPGLKGFGTSLTGRLAALKAARIETS